MSSQRTTEVPRQSMDERAQSLTQVTFWEHWGELSDLSALQFQMLWDDAKAHYTTLPYHNFSHARETLWGAMSLADSCEAHGLSVNRKALIGAALFHDAGYQDTGHGTPKEAYSATLFSGLAENYGFTEQETKLATELILATQLGAKLDSLEKKILVRADINNISGDYLSAFMRNTALLIREDIELRGEAHNYQDFMRHSILTLATYLSNDLSLGYFDTLGWAQRATANINRLIIQAAGDISLPIPDFVRGLGSSAVEKILRSREPGTTKDQAVS